MKITCPYTPSKHWLKGNFHTHTTISDGLLPLEEMVAMYRDDNYDFLAITNHRKYHDGKAGRAAAGKMILLPGEECHAEEDGFFHHMVSLGANDHVPEDLPTGQAVIDAINERGGLAFVAHPRWSYMTYEMFDSLAGYAGFEVYNGVCEKMSRGYSQDFWERSLAIHDKVIFGCAVDDTHDPQQDFGLGWTWANAAERSPEAIYDALRRGDYYASTGPRIENIRWDDESITVSCSPARLIKFIHGEYGMVRGYYEGANIRSATHRPRGDEGHIRIEVWDHAGRIAFTNPFTITP